jgi:polyribonucleotide nucleotidyltransferase
VEQFGAFVDFGFAKDGLVHISQLSVSSAGGVDPSSGLAAVVVSQAAGQ